ncbi:MAG: hypothetical protein ABIG34_00550 [Candidatus Peregrinibacteria bacterium]
MDIAETDISSQAEQQKTDSHGNILDAVSQTHDQIDNALSRHQAMAEKLKKFAAECAVPILSVENIDDVLGDKPYLSHALISGERLAPILDKGELLSSKKSGTATMTYETDKLIGMDKNVFLALGKGYMSEKGRFAFIFDPQKLAAINGATFVSDDLMRVIDDKKIIEDFLERHKQEIIQIIRTHKEKMNEFFRARVCYAFQGGYGIYGRYFDGSGNDRVEDFLQAIDAKGFHGIAHEAEVIDQYTILSDAILREDIMPSNLRTALIWELKEKIIDPHTVSGEENILRELQRVWDSDSGRYRKFLPEGSAVPESVTEVHIPNKLILRDALLGVYVPRE